MEVPIADMNVYNHSNQEGNLTHAWGAKGHMRSQCEHQEHYSETKGLVNRQHGAAGEEGTDSYSAETTLNQLLIARDGFNTGKGVVFLGATNWMDMLDPALFVQDFLTTKSVPYSTLCLLGCVDFFEVPLE